MSHAWHCSIPMSGKCLKMFRTLMVYQTDLGASVFREAASSSRKKLKCAVLE